MSLKNLHSAMIFFLLLCEIQKRTIQIGGEQGTVKYNKSVTRLYHNCFIPFFFLSIHNAIALYEEQIEIEVIY